MHPHVAANRRLTAVACAAAETALDGQVLPTAALAARAAEAARSLSKMPPTMISEAVEAAIVHAAKRTTSDLRTALVLVCCEPQSRPETIPALLASLSVVAPVSE